MTLMMETDKSETKIRHNGQPDGNGEFVSHNSKKTATMHNITLSQYVEHSQVHIVCIWPKSDFMVKKSYRSQAYDKITWAKIIFGFSLWCWVRVRIFSLLLMMMAEPNGGGGNNQPSDVTEPASPSIRSIFGMSETYFYRAHEMQTNFHYFILFYFIWFDSVISLMSVKCVCMRVNSLLWLLCVFFDKRNCF